MDLSIAGFGLALFLVLPGYLAVNLELWASRSKAAPRIGDWVAMSVLRSLVLNAVALPLWLAYADLVQFVPWNRDLAGTWQIASALTLGHVTDFLISLYGLAAVQGLVFGLAIKQWSALSWALQWKSISPHEDVWTDILTEHFRSKENLARRGTSEVRRPWIKLALDDGRIVVGQMMRSSVTIEQDKPIEVFLAPSYVLDQEQGSVEALGGLAGCDDLGLYLRVSPKTPVEILSARSDWQPQVSTTPSAT